MNIADYVLQKTLNTDGISQLLWTRVRRLLVQTFNDPPCSLTIHGHILRLPLSHELPAYQKLLPLYDSLPERLGIYLHDKYGSLKCLDVGANIGDTIAALYKCEHDQFLAIEPDPKFNFYLRENWGKPNIKIYDLVCAASSGTKNYEVVEKFGTASFRQNTRGMEFKTTTIDELLNKNPEFANPHLIKIDTDGQDFAIISGAQQTLIGQPTVLFECDVFGNTHYVEDCLETLELFRASGYRSMLVYDKFGYPLGRYELQNLIRFKDLLFYQLTKKFIYYDILLMKEDDLFAFYENERSFFLNALPDQRLRSSAEKL